MIRFINLTILVCFCLWIIPLGIFIKPASEQKTCGGQRAICLCSHTKDKSSSAKPMMVNPGINKEEVPSGGSNGHYILTASKRMDPLMRSKFFDHSVSQYSLIVCKSIEHIPKV